MKKDKEDFPRLNGKSRVMRLLNIFFGRTAFVIILMVIQIVLLGMLLYQFAAKYRAMYFAASSILTLLMFIFIFNKDTTNNSVKMTWLFLIAIAPVFAIPLYFFLFLDLGHRTEKAVLNDERRKADEHRFKDLDMARLKEVDHQLGDQVYYLENHAHSDAFTNSSAEYFPYGEQGFPTMLEELEKAEHFIFMEYFIIEEGEMWGKVLKILIDKVNQGVDVRVLYDGMNALVKLPYDYPKKLEKLGIKCMMFAPFRPFVSSHYNNRDHRKILVIDNRVAFTGGINLADEYINKKEVYGVWKDTCLMVKGTAVRGYTLMFLSIWNAMTRETEYDKYLEPVYPVQSGSVIVPYADSPMDKENVGETVYQNIIGRSEEYCWIMTPYLILDGEMLSSLKRAAKRGVDVRIILPHIPDKPYAFALAKTHYRELLTAGVKIYEFTPGFVHSKVMLSDGKIASVGTINLDYRSLYLHFECAALMYGDSALESIKKDFDDTFPLSEEIKLPYKPTLGYFLMGSLLKLIAPLL